MTNSRSTRLDDDRDQDEPHAALLLEQLVGDHLEAGGPRRLDEHDVVGPHARLTQQLESPPATSGTNIDS